MTYTYINKGNLKYLMLGRFTQDALENLFSNVRSRNPVPNAKEFKIALRLMSLSQFFSPPKHGSYGVSEQLLEFFKSNENTTEKIDDEIGCEESELELIDFNANDDTLISQSEIQSLYYLLGSILLKIKNNFKSCNDCLSSVITNNVDDDDSIKDLKKLVDLKCYKKNHFCIHQNVFLIK
jgi:hypothetical protein